MNNLHGLIFGIIQGITEFLPVSSSGHILLFSDLLKIKPPEILFDIILHFGTLFAVIIYFRKLIIKSMKNFKLLFLILISTISTGILYLAFKSFFEESFESIRYLPYFFLITSIFLLFFYFKNRRTKKLNEINYLDSVIIGVAQGFAIFPGISRSGFTFITALLLGIKNEEAFKYSFLLSIPAILLSGLLKTYEYIKNPFNMNYSVLLIGAISSFIFGVISIKLFYEFIKNKKFIYFSFYLIILSLIIFLIK